MHLVSESKESDISYNCEATWRHSTQSISSSTSLSTFLLLFGPNWDMTDATSTVGLLSCEKAILEVWDGATLLFRTLFNKESTTLVWKCIELRVNNIFWLFAQNEMKLHLLIIQEWMTNPYMSGKEIDPSPQIQRWIIRTKRPRTTHSYQLHHDQSFDIWRGRGINLHVNKHIFITSRVT